MKFNQPMLFGALALERARSVVPLPRSSSSAFEVDTSSSTSSSTTTSTGSTTTTTTASLAAAAAAAAATPTFSFAAKFGVFLCVPKTNKHECRMILLWNQSFECLDETSNFLGRFLRVVRWFSSQQLTPRPPMYEYLSSCCCRIGDKVLRIYDERFRRTHRSPEIYLDEQTECRDITGQVNSVFRLDTNKIPNEDNNFWSSRTVWDSENDTQKSPPNEYMDNRGLLIISVAYKYGVHCASTPRQFIPLITKLRSLHNLGYVHGDIRAYNCVFSNDSEGKPTGELIDFDFGGKCGTKTYPPGYKGELPDGDRIGKEEEPIEMWHDWYALGRLIFLVHQFAQLQNIPTEVLMSLTFRLRVLSDDMATSEPNIDDLVELLNNEDLNKYFYVEPNFKLRQQLNDFGQAANTMIATNLRGTGSPQKGSTRFKCEDVPYH